MQISKRHEMGQAPSCMHAYHRAFQPSHACCKPMAQVKAAAVNLDQSKRRWCPPWSVDEWICELSGPVSSVDL